MLDNNNFEDIILYSDITGHPTMNGEDCSITNLPYPLQLVAHKYWRANFGTLVGYLASWGKEYGLLLRRTCKTANEAAQLADKLKASVAEPAANAKVSVSKGQVVSLFIPICFPDNERNFRCAIYMAVVNTGEGKELYHLRDIDEDDYADFLALHQLNRWNGGIARRWKDAEKILIGFKEPDYIDDGAYIPVYVALRHDPKKAPEDLCNETVNKIKKAAEEIREKADEGGWCLNDPDDLVCAALCATVPDRWEYAPAPDFEIEI